MGMLAVVGLLGAVSLVIALGFLVMGAPLVLPFAGLETLALFVAVWVHARYLDRADEVWVREGQVHVRTAGDRRMPVQALSFPAAWLQLRCDASTDELIALSAGGREVRIGGRLSWPQRQAVAQEMAEKIRGTLRQSA